MVIIMVFRVAIPFALLFSMIGAVDLRYREAPLQDGLPLLPRTTGAPSPGTVKLRLAERAGATDIFRYPSCASSCITSAIVSGTNCQAGDWNCACQFSNGPVISSEAAGCVRDACGGAASASRVWSILTQECITYLYLTYSFLDTDVSTNPTVTATETGPGTTLSPSTVVVTTTASNGSSVTVTAVINPTGPSATTGPSSNPSDPSSSPSKGAVAGIAVGATIGGLALVGAIVWLLFRRRSRRPLTESAQTVAATTEQNPPTFPDKPELPGIGKTVSPVSVSETPVSAHSPLAAGLLHSSAAATLMPSSMTTTTPTPSLPVTELSGTGWQQPQQQTVLYQAVPTAEGGFVMVPVQSNRAAEMPGRDDAGAVEVAGETGTAGTRQELPAQGYDHGPYEMPGHQVG